MIRTKLNLNQVKTPKVVRNQPGQPPRLLSTWDQALLDVYKSGDFLHKERAFAFSPELVLSRLPRTDPRFLGQEARVNRAINAGWARPIGGPVSERAIGFSALRALDRPSFRPDDSRVSDRIKEMSHGELLAMIQSGHQDEMKGVVAAGRASAIGKTADQLGLDENFVQALRKYEMIGGADEAQLTDGQFDQMPLHVQYLVIRQAQSEQLNRKAFGAARWKEMKLDIEADRRKSFGNPLVIGKKKIEAVSAKQILDLADVSRGLWRLEDNPTHYVLFLDREKTLATPGVVVPEQVFPELTLSAYHEQGIKLGRGSTFDWIERNRDISVVRIVPEKFRQELASAYGDKNMWFGHYLTSNYKPPVQVLYKPWERSGENPDPAVRAQIEGQRVRAAIDRDSPPELIDAARIRHTTLMALERGGSEFAVGEFYKIPSKAWNVVASNGRKFRLVGPHSEIYSKYKEVKP